MYGYVMLSGIFRNQFLNENHLPSIKMGDILKYVKKTRRYDEFLMDF